MKTLACLFTLGLLSLSACAAELSQSAARPPLPSPSPSQTPDAFAIALGQAQSQATLQAMDATYMAISIRLTQTMAAPTQHAEQTATQQAWAITGWTVTAAIQQTATAVQWTPNPNCTATVSAAQAAAQATALHGEAVSVALAMERERTMNQVQAIAPWAALAATLITLLVIAVRWSQVRPIQRDARGDAIDEDLGMKNEEG